MTKAELQEIEQALNCRLPKRYKDLMLSFPTELREWPPLEPSAPADRRDDFLHGPDAIIAANKDVAKKFRKRVPPNSFVFGGDSKGYWLIDLGIPDPPVRMINKEWLLDGFVNLDEHLEFVKRSHQEASKTAKKRRRPGAAKADSKAALTPDDLIAEGRKLARPAVALHDTGKKYAAVWRGAGVADPGPGEWRHWISIDTSYLPDNPRKLKGVVSLYEWFADDDRMGELKVVHSSKATLPRNSDGTKLFARRFDCIPDVDALIHFGSKRIRDWAKATDWEANPVYDRTPVKEYLDVVAAEHPFQSGDGAYAMLGGWSWCFNWCYGIDQKYPWQLMKKALIVLTIAESEPWLEVFDDGRKFVTFSRIT